MAWGFSVDTEERARAAGVSADDVFDVRSEDGITPLAAWAVARLSLSWMEVAGLLHVAAVPRNRGFMAGTFSEKRALSTLAKRGAQLVEARGGDIYTATPLGLDLARQLTT